MIAASDLRFLNETRSFLEDVVRTAPGQETPVIQTMLTDLRRQRSVLIIKPHGEPGERLLALLDQFIPKLQKVIDDRGLRLLIV